MASLLCDLGNRLYFFLGYQGYLILNIYTVLEFSILCYVYSILLKAKKIIFIYSVIFLIVFCLCTAFYQPINSFQNIPLVLESLAMITFASIYFINMYHDLPTETLSNYFPVWVNASIFYYFAFDFYLFALSESVFKNGSTNVGLVLWFGFHSFNNISKNCLIAVGLLTSRNQLKENTQGQL